MIDYESTSGLDGDRFVGGYNYEYDNLGADGEPHPDTMPVTVWLVRGEDEDDREWWSWREDCDGGSSDHGEDFLDAKSARSDAEKHLARMIEGE